MKYLITYALLHCVTTVQDYRKAFNGKDTVYVGTEKTKCDTLKYQAREFVGVEGLNKYLENNKKDILNLKVYQFEGKDVTKQFKIK